MIHVKANGIIHLRRVKPLAGLVLKTLLLHKTWNNVTYHNINTPVL